MITETNSYLWEKFCDALEDGRISVILEDASDTIDGGVIVTDIGDIIDHLTGR